LEKLSGFRLILKMIFDKANEK
jgi:hypothetical protein